MVGKSRLSVQLYIAFTALAAILLTAVALALYLSQQLGEAVDQTTQRIIPLTRAALSLSERSATLAATAPMLAHADSTQQLEMFGQRLGSILEQMNAAMTYLYDQADPNAVAQVRGSVEELSSILGSLKRQTADRLDLQQRQDAYLSEIHVTHNDFLDTISPVVYGVSSLNRLIGKRLARRLSNDLRQELQRDLQRISAMQRLRESLPDGATETTPQQQALWLRQAADPKPLSVAQDLTPEAIDHEFQAALAEMKDILSTHALSQRLDFWLARARKHLQQQLDGSLRQMQALMADFSDQTTHDVGRALDIKAEGSVLFALLAVTVDTEKSDAVISLQDRFNRSQAIFSDATQTFLGTPIARRNPILADNIERIQQRVSAFGAGASGLFSQRLSIVANQQATDRLMVANLQVAQRLTEQVDGLLAQIDQETTLLQMDMEQQRHINEQRLVVVCLGGLLLAAMISFVTVRILDQRELELSQAAAILDSTREGVMVTDTQGRILTTNPAFTEITGYSAKEVRYQRAGMLQSGRHDKEFYAALWRQLGKTGYWQGELYNQRKNGDCYPQWLTISAVRNASGQTTHYAGVFSDISIIKQSQEKLDYLAHHDALTGLPNRLLLVDRLRLAVQRVKRRGEKLAVLFLDLDGFKNINDTLGHSAGDRFLKQIAARLQAQMRGEDTVARLGGDEFMVLLEVGSQLKDVGSVAKKILAALAQPIDIEQRPLVVTTSIGISLYPDDGTTAETLIRNADTAMYRAKERGKNNYQFYNPEFTAHALERFSIEGHLRHALERGEFELYYQPQYSQRRQAIIGAEALLRWNHPEQGMLAPTAFLSVVEEIGMMEALGDWVVSTTCRQLRDWLDQGLAVPCIAVNISASQLNSQRLIDSTRAILTYCQINPTYLEMELTEGAILQNPEKAISTLQSLRDMGVGLAIDDFGTGYSSLSYLKRLPIHKLKIDRSFVLDIANSADDKAIPRAIIALARTLRLEVIAEGVENSEQERCLRDEGCDMVQGYYYSRPLPATGLADLLRQ